MYAGQGLKKLPNLFLTSVITVSSLYLVLAAFLIVLVELQAIEMMTMWIILLLVVIIQFLLGPWLMDISLRFLYKMDWKTSAQLPAHIDTFLKKMQREYGMGYPKFGIINDDAPQAFTYGHSPKNARIVISSGLLKLLNDDEVDAVIAHECGHVIRWDMLLMTVVQLVPLLLYQIYRTFMRSAQRSRKKGSGGAFLIAIIAYIIYIISEYLVLFFSRIREYHADRFAGEVTNNPSLLASALVKIAYGMSAKKDDEGNGKVDRIGAMGIFDKGAAASMAISAYSGNVGAADSFNLDGLKNAMKWDMWNPWAKWYELNSTHPLVAKRLLALSDQAEVCGQKPFITFNEQKPESYVDEFLFDIFIYLLPVITLIGGIIYSGIHTLVTKDDFTNLIMNPSDSLITLLKYPLGAFGLALMIKYKFIFPDKSFSSRRVTDLLAEVEVSETRPIPCRLEGEIVGKGIPGYIFSEDFVLKDETGIIFLDYRQPLAIWEFFFAILSSGNYIGKKAVIEGWYHRSPVPYVKIRTITADGKTRKSYVPFVSKAFALSLIIASAVLIIMDRI